MAQTKKLRTAAQIKSVKDLTSSLPTMSAKMRALDHAGWTRADIARGLDRRYQHVKNVLDRPLQQSAVTSK